MTSRASALLVFEDGTTERGYAFGARGEAFGEVVFNTAMMGYQEILTDPSYCGQLVVMTYPLIGNYGVNPDDVESSRVHTGAFIVRELSRITSNHRASGSLDDYLKENGVVGIEGVDTRAIVRHVRTRGALRAVVSSMDLDVNSLHRKVLASEGLDGRDLVREVTRPHPEVWRKGLDRGFLQRPKTVSEPRLKVVAYDFGIKNNILRGLVSCGFDVTVVPAQTPAEEALRMNPDGIFLSNGPGDPEPVSYAIDTIKTFLDRQVPLFGICLGHQLTALALGARTFKMKFGHHGANHPVIDVKTGRTEITSQNHSFAVDADSIDSAKATISHTCLNDNVVEGLELTQAPAFTVQYHPEASPGPHDSLYLFDRFRDLILKQRSHATAEPVPS